MFEVGWTSSKRQVNDLALHVVEAGPADGPLVILLHGFPEFWWAWRNQITPLARLGFHVVAPDMRGYNESDIPEGVAAYRLGTLAADVVALADVFDARSFNLVGHDWGGVVAWWVGATCPGRLDRLIVLDAPHPDVLGGHVAQHLRQALRSAYLMFFQLPWLPEAVLGIFDHAALRAAMQGSARRDTFKPGDLERYAEAWAHPGSLTAMLDYYRALRERERTEPARIRVPTLVIWGGEDSFLERHVAEACVGLCDRGRLLVIAAATHWVHLEESERVTTEIADFIRFGDGSL